MAIRERRRPIDATMLVGRVAVVAHAAQVAVLVQARRFMEPAVAVPGPVVFFAVISGLLTTVLVVAWASTGPVVVAVVVVAAVILGLTPMALAAAVEALVAVVQRAQAVVAVLAS